MTGFLGRPSASGIRWVARIMGTLLGLLLLAEFIEWLTGTKPPAALRDYLLAVGWLLIISGFVVGWFKELAASLLVLGRNRARFRNQAPTPRWGMALADLHRDGHS